METAVVPRALCGFGVKLRIPRISCGCFVGYRNLGVNFIDTADAYGPHISEILIRETLHPYDGLVIATKGRPVCTAPDQWVPLGRPGVSTRVDSHEHAICCLRGGRHCWPPNTSGSPEGSAT